MTHSTVPKLVQWSDLTVNDGARMVLIGSSHYPLKCAIEIARGVAELLGHNAVVAAWSEAIPLNTEQTAELISSVTAKGVDAMRMLGFAEPENKRILRQHMSEEEYAAMVARLAA